MKKFLAGLLSGVMVLSMAACGGTNQAATSGTKATESAATTTKSEDTTKAENTGSTSEYDQAIAERKAKYEETGEYEKVVYAIYTWTGKPAGTDRVQEAMNVILREKLGLEVELMVLDFASYRQDVPLMLSGDEEIDWFGGNAIGYVSAINNGYCYDLEEDGLLQKYAPTICELISESYRDACRFGGTLYGIPPMKDIAITYGAMCIGKEYLDGIGYEYKEDENQQVPATWDEISEIFVKLHEKYPDKYVLSGAGNQFGQGSKVDNIGGDWFGVLLDPANSLEVVDLFESEEWMTMCKQYNEWNKLGYFSADALSDKTSSTAKIKTGNYMAFMSQAKPGYKSQISGECGREMIVFILGDEIIKSSGVSSVITCLNSGCEDPVAAMQVMNELYADADLSTLLIWGQEGKDYVYTDDGHITFPEGVDAQNAEYYHTMNWELPNQYLAPVWVGDPLDLGEATMEFNASAPQSKAMGFTFDNSEYRTTYTALQNVYDQYADQLLYGFLDPEAGTEEFVKELKAAGLDDYIKEKARQLDEWAKANGKQ